MAYKMTLITNNRYTSLWGFLLLEIMQILIYIFVGVKKIASDIRSEATNLLEEIKLLSKRNEELMAERNRYVGSNVRGGLLLLASL